MDRATDDKLRALGEAITATETPEELRALYDEIHALLISLEAQLWAASKLEEDGHLDG